MLEKRWRVKVGCGLYVLKCTKIKQIQRDMWTEIPVGAVLESTYYRYLYFYEDGRVLYSLTSKAPHEMVPIFKKIYFTGDAGHSGIFGSYEIQKDNVVVNVKHPWHHVRFHLKVLDQGAFGPGLFWELKLERHLSSAKNDFDEYWSRDLVEYNVPVEHFRFIRNWQL
jgi:F-box protein 9